MDAHARPLLDLSGPPLKSAFEALAADADGAGGVERLTGGINAKSELFHAALADGRADALDPESFARLCAFMAPVRRHIGAWLGADEFPALRAGIVALMENARDTGDGDAVDRRIEQFCDRVPAGRPPRWVRDLAGELLHGAYPEHYPLMARWVWDRRANTGVLREIWHGDNVDHITIEAPDNYATFLMLREELARFLAENGVFRDVLAYVDLLCAQIYARYICEQGGAYLRTDFASDMDAGILVRRMLGLDGIDPRTGRTRVKRAGGGAYVLTESGYVC